MNKIIQYIRKVIAAVVVVVGFSLSAISGFVSIALIGIAFRSAVFLRWYRRRGDRIPMDVIRNACIEEVEESLDIEIDRSEFLGKLLFGFK